MSALRPRILTIDDTPANLLTLGRALAPDFDLQIATSGAMGLELAEKSPPDLILLDVMMPEMDGFETCRRFKANPALRTIPIIFVTALAESEAESTGLSLGAADYLTKPINVDIARQRIRNLLEREQLRKEVEQHRDHLEDLVRARTTALAIAKEAAETAHRAKNAFLSNMSHELRTPLNAVMGMTELALRQTEDPKLRERLQQIGRSSRQLLGVITSVLDMSKLEAEHLDLERISFLPAQILEHVTNLIAPKAAEKKLQLELSLSPDVAGQALLGDPTRLGQILLNLAGNAIKFSDKGEVRIRIFTVEKNASDILLRFEVSDNGIGVSTEDQIRLFHAFEQADTSATRKYSGTGLGLAISRRLVQLMGGEIGVDSTPNKGSTFWFTARLEKIPSSECDITSTSAAIPAEERLRQAFHSKRVLLLENEPINQEVFRELLEEVGLIPTLSDNGQDALNIARNGHYDLILINIGMHDINGQDGLTTARNFRTSADLAQIPILSIASNSAEEWQACQHIGITDHVNSPIDPEQLFEAVLRCLSQRASNLDIDA